MDNIYYVIGVHSSGKTTLVNSLVSRCMFGLLERVDIDIQSNDPFTRAFLRVLKYSAEYKRHQETAKKTSDRLIGDRCVYDSLAYADSYLRLGWISTGQYTKIFTTYQNLWSTNNPRNIIFLDPSFEWVTKRLRVRWETSQRRWQEDNFEFLRELIDSYRNLFGRYNSDLGVTPLVIKETSLEERIRIVEEWLNSK